MKQNQSNGYMLLFRGTDWQKNLSPDEMQNVMSQWMSWFEGLSAKGKVAGGDPLEREARVISKKGSQIVVDGVFPEANEAVAGYFKLTVDTFEEAEAIGKQCPVWNTALWWRCVPSRRTVAVRMRCAPNVNLPP